jgi:hypothetical protein
MPPSALAIIEILLFMIGLSTWFGGRLRLPRGFALEAKAARWVAALLMLPLPLAFAAGLTFGELAAAGAIPASLFAHVFWIEAALTAACLAAALVCARAGRAKADAAPEPGGSDPDRTSGQ